MTRTPGTPRSTRPPRLRIGVVGLGVISRFHLAALDRSADARTVAVADPDPRTCEGLPAHIARYRDHRDLLRSAGVDAVVVNVPNDLHFSVCTDALAAGLPVCVEKPLATGPHEARRLAALARESGVPLLTSFHRRYNAEVQALRRRLPADVPVDSLTVRYEETIEEHAGRDRWYLDPARCGGGCLADNGPNALDLVRLFLGGDLAVDGVRVHRDGRGVDRSALLRLRTGGGAAARVVLDWSYPGERKTVEVRLADGRTDSADMLAGHGEFKGSLWHEYEGVLGEFAALVRAGSPVGGAPDAAPPGRAAGTEPDGVAVAELVAAAYAAEDRTEAPA